MTRNKELISDGLIYWWDYCNLHFVPMLEILQFQSELCKILEESLNVENDPWNPWICHSVWYVIDAATWHFHTNFANFQQRWKPCMKNVLYWLEMHFDYSIICILVDKTRHLFVFQKLDFADIIMCKCCTQSNDCCAGDEPLCDVCIQRPLFIYCLLFIYSFVWKNIVITNPDHKHYAA